MSTTRTQRTQPSETYNILQDKGTNNFQDVNGNVIYVKGTEIAFSTTRTQRIQP